MWDQGALRAGIKRGVGLCCAAYILHVEMDLWETDCESVNWVEPTLDRVHCQLFVLAVLSIRVLLPGI
jgi:hypothetical protein